jgi:hypothetical protein
VALTAAPLLLKSETNLLLRRSDPRYRRTSGLGQLCLLKLEENLSALVRQAQQCVLYTARTDAAHV